MRLLLLLCLFLPACDQDNGPGGAPPLPPVQASDLLPFPARAVVRSNMVFARQHIAWLECRCELEPRNTELLDWLWHARECWSIWDELDTCQRNSGEYQMAHLAILRDRLGLADYYAGRLPPPVPLERFREMR